MASGSTAVTTVRRFFDKERHGNGGQGEAEEAEREGIVAQWNSKEKIKTAAAALVVCLNVGVDPPGFVRISPCPTKQCWIDPITAPQQRALETIGKNLQTQYERWQPRAKYRLALDPTQDQVRKVCTSLRRTAKGERVLFHYNGHGVPKPTNNGEIWVFNSHYTQYIPLSVYDLQCWLSNPVIYVLDCPSAGTIVDSVIAFMNQAAGETGVGAAPFLSPDKDPMKGTILMGACRPNESLDTHPDFPADLFTSCLTTPVKVALRWLLRRSLAVDGKLTPDLIDSVPGLPQERKSPLGELHWIFTAVTDSIAWDILPSGLFQKLFRQDLLVASLFRNFLLAERVMSSMGVMPVSFPRLPPTYNHHLWQTWDVAAERILLQLPDLLLLKPPREFRLTSFFSEQLDAFALSLKFGSRKKAPPQQLPVVLQVLLSPVHRVRALELLYDFMELGSWAVELSLSVGVFPYVLKLLQTTAMDLQRTLIGIWAKLLALDSSCQSDLCKDGGHEYFIHYLEQENRETALKAKATAILTLICFRYPQGQKLCLEAHVLAIFAKLLLTCATDEHYQLRCEAQKWICLGIWSVCEGRPEAVCMASRNRLPEILLELVFTCDPEVRTAAVCALTSLVTLGHTETDLQPFDLALFEHLATAGSKLVYDGSPAVRLETAFLLRRLVQKPTRESAFEAAMSQLQRDADVQSSGLQRHALPVTSTVQKVGHLFGLKTEEKSTSRPDILKWTTEDCAQAQQSHTFYQRTASSEGMVDTSDCHRRILEDLCFLAIDGSQEVAQVALGALHAIHWDLEFSPPTETPKISPLPHAYSEPAIHETLLTRVGSLVRKKSKSKTSHDSPPGTSGGHSSTSGSTESPDYQEQAQILHTRIDLTWRFCQRRAYKIKRLSRSKERPTNTASTSRDPHGAASHRVSDVDDYYARSPPIFWLCRKALADPHPVHRKKGQRDDGGEEIVDFGKGITCVGLKEMTLSQKVLNVKTNAENIGSLVLDATRDLVAVSDREGHVFIHDYGTQSLPEISSFSLTGPLESHQGHVPDFVDTVSLFCLDVVQSVDRLMACSSDGSVRVWDHCTDPDACTRRSVWQAVPICAPPSFVLAPACFDWQPMTGHLFSASLSRSGIVHQMDLEYEILIQQFAVDNGSRPSIDFLKCFFRSPNLLAVGSGEGRVRLFDVRTNTYVCSAQPFKEPISAMTPVSTNRDEQLVVMSTGGVMKHLEIRQSNEAVLSSLAVHSTIRAHSSGYASALISHPVHPIMTSASLHPVIKVWTDVGEQISSIRPFKKYKENCQQAVTTLAFHPSNWGRFAAGGKGRICGIYNLTHKE